MGRLLGSAALLLLWLNLQVQAHGVWGDALDPRTLGARAVLCYVAAFWLHLAWQGLMPDAHRPAWPRE